MAIDARVVLFTGGVTLATALVSSLAPALRAGRVDATQDLKDGTEQTGGSRDRVRVQGLLVASQLALAVILMVAAGLMLRSLWALQRVDLGFDPRNTLTMRLSLPATAYDSPERVVEFYRTLLRRVRVLPGVRAAGLIRSLPLAAQIGDWSLDIDGFVESPGRNAKGDWQVASDGAIEALDEHLVRGRTFTDAPDSQPVALINETMAAIYWPDGDPIGERIRMGSNADRPWLTIVGIIGNVTHNGVTAPIKEKFYVPHSQFHRATGNTLVNMTLVLRAEGDPLTLLAPVRAEVRHLDPNLPVSNVRPMSDAVSDSIGAARFAGTLLAAFASLALMLAALGTYGVVAYFVSRRTHEIGIRMAMGAGRARVMAHVIGRGSRLVALGLAAGIGGAMLATRTMTSLLHGVDALDPWTFAAAPALLLMVALAACLVPAIRATRIDPIRAIRN